MKRWRSFLLSGVMLAGLACGCGKAPPEHKPVPGDPPSTAPKQPKAETPSAAAPIPAPPASAAAPAGVVRLAATQGSKVRIDGTANMIHTRWAVEGKLIGGFIEAGANFPVQPGQSLNPGGTQARVEAFIPVRSLKSIDDDGKPYSDKMDDIMYEKLKAVDCPKIFYRLKELVFRDTPQGDKASYVCDTQGDLVVAGVTNSVAMRVNVQPLAMNRVKISGSAEVKMTQFNIQPPEVNLILGKLKTGDAVKLSVDWMLEQKKAIAAAGP
jgi:hypothetical protein